ncbi:hypothetical protein BD779DRAFT_1218441 [Infundibulicybe gibba]|nr:hypothetical protein BD779DRAFT_1218441 [Infundibulicybe gibba]
MTPNTMENIRKLGIRAKTDAKGPQCRLSELDVAARRLAQVEAEKNALETDQLSRGMRVTQAVLDAQQDASKANAEVGLLKMQLENAQREIGRAQDAVWNVETQRNNAMRDADSARASARRLKEENIMMIAQEQGRKEGYEEGLRQGRILAITRVQEEQRFLTHRPRGQIDDGIAFIEEYDEEGTLSPNTPRHRRQATSINNEPIPIPPPRNSLELVLREREMEMEREREEMRREKAHQREREEYERQRSRAGRA